MKSEFEYEALQRNEFFRGDYALRTIYEEDMEKVRLWRNAQLSVLRQPFEISQADQKYYFESVIKTSFTEKETKQLIFSFFKNNKIIGYGGLVNLSWIHKRGEMSFLLDDLRAENSVVYKEDMGNFIFLIRELIFEELKFNRVFTETFAFRELHISILEENGFVNEGVLRNHNLDAGHCYDSIIHGIIREDIL